jgi:phosphatidylglycerol:prolipoprotein diacylglycerol transferase
MTFLHQINPVLIELGPLKVHWYGIMYMLGFAAAWALGRRRVRAGRLPGVDEQAYSDLLFYSMLGVIFGARIGYVLFYDLDNYLREPLLIFKIWQGGMSFHGGLLGVLAAGLWWSRKYKTHFFDVIDFLAPLVPPGLGLGRLGNFINGELWGKYTEAGWGVIFPYAEAGMAQMDGAASARSTPPARSMRWRAIPASCINSRWKASRCSAFFGGSRANRATVTRSPACSRCATAVSAS